MGLGSLVAMKRLSPKFSYPNLILSLIFGITLFLIHSIKSFFQISYYQPSNIFFVVAWGIALITPISFTGGFIFSKTSQKISRNQPNPKVEIIAYEGLGFLIGGLLFSICFSFYTNPFWFILTPLLLTSSTKRKEIFLSVIIIILTVLFTVNFNNMLKKEFNQTVIVKKYPSPYGAILETDLNKAKSLYAGGSLLSTSEDVLLNEQFIHTSLCTTMEKPSILFAGFFSENIINQLLKHSPKKIDLVYPDKAIVDLAKNQFIKNPKITFITKDPIYYLNHTDKKYDFIFFNFPPPENINLNRYLTFETFSIVKNHLLERGVFSFFIPSKKEILSPKFADFNSCIINTLNKTFTNHLLIPGDSLLILASSFDIANKTIIENFIKKNISTKYLQKEDLKDLLDPYYQNYIENSLKKNIPTNTFLNLKGFIYYFWLEQTKFFPRLKLNFEVISTWVIGLFSVIVFLLLFFAKNRPFVCYPILLGFLSFSTNSIIAILFQTYAGSLFWKVGLLYGLFMSTLCLGIFLIKNKKAAFPKPLLIIFFGWLICLGVIIIFIKLSLFSINPSWLYLFSAWAGILTGFSYPLIVNNFSKNTNPEKIISYVYSADLIGAFLAILFIPLIFIPLAGIFNTCLMLFFLEIIFCIYS